MFTYSYEFVTEDGQWYEMPGAHTYKTLTEVTNQLAKISDFLTGIGDTLTHATIKLER